MVDVAAIFDEVFGADEQDKGSSKKRCARCAGVPEGHKLLKNLDTLGTPSEVSGHTFQKGVPDESERCARDIVENQEVASEGTRAHRAHLKTDNPSKPADSDAFEERAGIIHEAHTIAIDDDGAPLPEPIFTLTREQAEWQAAQEQGFDDADTLNHNRARAAQHSTRNRMKA